MSLEAPTTNGSRSREDSCISHSTQQLHTITGRCKSTKHASLLTVFRGTLKVYLSIFEGTFPFTIYLHHRYIIWVFRNAAAVIMKIAYGYTINKDQDYFVTLIEDFIKTGTFTSAPGRWLVDSFPFRNSLVSLNTTLSHEMVLSSSVLAGVVSWCWLQEAGQNNEFATACLEHGAI